MQSAAGEQTGWIGSTCIRCGSAGICDDRPLLLNESLKSVVLVHPGDELTIAMPGAQLQSSPRCVPSCVLHVDIQRLSCAEGQLQLASRVTPETLVTQTPIGQDQPWTLSVEPGLYLVSVDGGDFVTAGMTGGASGIWGLLVDPERERGIVPAAPFHAECAGALLSSDDR